MNIIFTSFTSTVWTGQHRGDKSAGKYNLNNLITKQLLTYKYKYIKAVNKKGQNVWKHGRAQCMVAHPSQPSKNDLETIWERDKMREGKRKRS